MNGKPCVICGARIRNPNSKVITCSPECTIEKNTGKTREQQIREECRITDDTTEVVYREKNATVVLRRKKKHLHN